MHEDEKNVTGFRNSIQQALDMIQGLEAGAQDAALKTDLSRLRDVVSDYNKAFGQVYQNTLAMQTAQATHEIAERVDNIQSATQGAVGRIIEISSAIGDVDAVISSITEAITEQTDMTGKIAVNVNEASTGIDQINTHIAQAAGKAEAVSKDIGEVDGAAATIASDGMTVDEQANELLGLAEQLQALVDRFIVQ